MEPCPILVVQPGAGFEGFQRAGNAAHFTLEVLRESLSFDVAIRRDRVKLSDLVPMAWAVASEIGRAVVGSTEQAGGTIACTKGCCACCGYLVPLSVPEVFRLEQDVRDMPTGRRETVLRLSVESARRILDRRPSRSIGTGPSQTDARITVNRISRWYGRLGLPCIFLSDGACTFYDNRPIACREHLVECSSESCAPGSSEMPQVVLKPVSVVEALARLAVELEGLPAESIILPFALAWARDNVKRAEKTWPAALMVKRFFGILAETTSQNPVPHAVLV